MNEYKLLNPKYIPFEAFVLAISFWFIDSAIDTYVFNSSAFYIDNLINPDAIVHIIHPAIPVHGHYCIPRTFRLLDYIL